MKASVRTAFVAFTSPLEGVVPWMYQDVKGLITTAIGNLIDPIQYAMQLPWVHEDGSPAGRDEIAAEWMRVKQSPAAAQRGHRFTEGITNLRLMPDGVQLVVSRKMAQMDGHLQVRFVDFEEWPADAQLATLSVAWACGPAFRFPKLEEALRSRDFDAAKEHCTIREDGNPGVHPRNVANRRLYGNAARVVAFKLDPDALVWPATVEDAIDTHPDLVQINTPITTPATLPTVAPHPIIHADPRLYFIDRDPDDPDEAA